MPPPREAVGVGGGLRRIGLLVSAARSRPGGRPCRLGPLDGAAGCVGCVILFATLYLVDNMHDTPIPRPCQPHTTKME